MTHAAKIDARRLPLLGAVFRVYQDRLTARGRLLLWTLAGLGAMGLDTMITRVYVLFAVGPVSYTHLTLPTN